MLLPRTTQISEKKATLSTTRKSQNEAKTRIVLMETSAKKLIMNSMRV
jgi:hypothetical protein